jgi:RNA recognition motif-containing protein
MAEATKLFVGGLPYSLDEPALTRVFERFGAIIHCKIVRDRDTQRSRGFGFVEFETVDDAQEAMTVMAGSLIEGRECNIAIARDRPGYGPYGKRHQSPSSDVEFVRKRGDGSASTEVRPKKIRPARRRQERRDS